MWIMVTMVMIIKIDEDNNISLCCRSFDPPLVISAPLFVCFESNFSNLSDHLIESQQDMVAGKLYNNYLATTNSNNTHRIHVEQMMQWDQLVRVKK